MTYARKKDANHADLATELRARGYSVDDLGAVGRGVPDLYVSRAGHGRWVEVKAPKGGKKRGAVQAASLARQAAFRERHAGLVVTATHADEVDAAFSAAAPDAPASHAPTR